MIGIIDYGSGNLKSVYNAFKYLGEDVVVCGQPGDLDRCDKLVLPGVGSSKDAMEGLRARGYLEELLRNIDQKKPFLGICLGLQLLFDRSEEASGCDCMGLFKGDVRCFHPSKGLKVPQIGWNDVNFKMNGCPLFEGIDNGEYFYFVHSYYCPYAEEYTAASTTYGIEYTSVLWKDNIFAVQFHPERSQDSGLKLLENFTKI